MARKREETTAPKPEGVARYTKRLLWPAPANNNKIPLSTWLRWIGVWSVIGTSGVMLYLFA